jgi:hypothetical protein
LISDDKIIESCYHVIDKVVLRVQTENRVY